MYFLHCDVVLRVVVSVGQTLAVGHQALLVRLSLPQRACRRLVLLHDGALLLLVPLHLTVRRCQTEGFLGNVHPPQRHHPPDDVLLD